jgi:plasmid stabilization system protein ParE
MKLRFLRIALADIEGIAQYVSADNPVAAQRIVVAIRTACENLVTFPGIGRPGRRSGTREWVVTGLPYIVIYRVRETSGQLEILRVYHGRRDPVSIGIIEDEP